MKCDHAGPLANVRSRLTSTCSAASAPAVTCSVTPNAESVYSSP